MAIEQIGAISAIQDIGMLDKPVRPAQADFADFLGDQLQQTNSLINEAEHQVQLLATGQTDNLHRVMLALSEAKTEFELTVQVRNKLLEGFQEVMRMQI